LYLYLHLHFVNAYTFEVLSDFLPFCLLIAELFKIFTYVLAS